MKTKWLDRRIAAPGPHLALCLSDAEFRAAVAHLKLPEVPKWIMTAHSHATAHFFRNPQGNAVAVVCLGGAWGEREPIEIAGLLVHEAVHVWQEYCAGIGEHNPGSEQEAYGIQSIAQELMAEFARRAIEKQREST